MCSGAAKTSPPLAGSAMDSGDLKEITIPSLNHEEGISSLLLELAASDDVAGFKKAVEEGALAAGAAALWYGRIVGAGRRKVALDRRTPLQIAALYGSTDLISHILSVAGSAAAAVNTPCGSDGATALHLAAAGGSPSSFDAARLLIAASADVDALDAAGNRPGDLIPRHGAPRGLDALLRSSSSPPRTPSPAPSPAPPAKKEYPPDLTLPDIKNGVYGTDEFRMYSFKVKPCSRAYSHDWTECPFVHPGENARRRDPRKYLYSCVPCPEFRKGSCRSGDGCEYAHGVFESWLHPAQYRTRLCKDEIGCNRRVCFFAHKPEELRSVNPSGAAAVSSPRSSGMSPLDVAATMMLIQQGGGGSGGGPLSPSGAASPSSWMNLPGGGGGGASPSPMQLQSSRLKSTLSARDLDLNLNLNLDLLGVEGYQKKLMEEIAAAAAASSSPRANWAPYPLAGTRASDYTDLIGSPISGYGGKLPSSPSMSRNLSSQFSGLEHAFAKRSLSFADRRQAAASPAAMGLSDWGSPTGKLDWGIRGEELSKLRKSSSFANRGVVGAAPGSPAAAAARGFDEPDLSWVQTLVKDGGAGASPELLPAWADQPYAEQEQLVA